jgi:mevalonate kinase
MLFGEHSVLRGRESLVAAVEPRITVKLTPVKEKTITVQSSLGTATTPIHSVSLGENLRFVEKALSLFQRRFSTGAHILIESKINPSVGLGSSAAVTVATLACLLRWLDLSEHPFTLLKKAIQVIKSVQGCGSGADAAASILGGVVQYGINPLSAIFLRENLPLTLVYSGKKTPTPEVIAYVKSLERSFPRVFESIFDSMEQVTLQASSAICRGNWKRLGKLMDIHNGLQQALLVGTEELSSIFWDLKRSKSIYGAKISGSGLGDSMIGLGTLKPEDPCFRKQIPICVAREGVLIDEG